jgi:hypothetical protein
MEAWPNTFGLTNCGDSDKFGINVRLADPIELPYKLGLGAGLAPQYRMPTSISQVYSAKRTPNVIDL